MRKSESFRDSRLEFTPIVRNLREHQMDDVLRQLVIRAGDRLRRRSLASRDRSCIVAVVVPHLQMGGDEHGERLAQGPRRVGREQRFYARFGLNWPAVAQITAPGGP